MTTATKPVKGALPGPCCVCGGRLRFSAQERRLTCRGCNLDVSLTAAETREVLWYQAAPGLQDAPWECYLPALMARHHCYPANVEPDPRVISTKPRPDTHKRRILPTPGLTQAERLSEQARLNGIQVEPIHWTAAGVPTLFRVSSGERDEALQPVCWYEPVEVSPFRAHCPCICPGLCSHLLAVKDWLIEWEARQRPAVMGEAERHAAQERALSDLYGV